MAYRLALPPYLSGVHPIFLVSLLKKYHGDVDYIFKLDPMVLDKYLQYEEEPIAILDCDVRKLRIKEIKSVKVQWNSKVAWLHSSKINYPCLPPFYSKHFHNIRLIWMVLNGHIIILE